MGTFIPGIELSAALYAEVVRPLLTDIPHSAALVGHGSEILGFDTERSTDHGWGNRLTVFVEADAVAVNERVQNALPLEFKSWPTRYGWDAVPVQPHVNVYDLSAWLQGQLGFDPRAGMSTIDWLTTPQQLILEVVSGRVFHDGLAELGRVRKLLAWYPRDVWVWMIASLWVRISQEEAFVGRTAEVGDDLGSALVASRLTRDLMRLCFLFERRYTPYMKWFGSAFSQLGAAADLTEPLKAAIAATSYNDREAALAEALEKTASLHNRLGIGEWQDPSTRHYFGRPFQVLHAERFAAAARAAISDPFLRDLPLTGTVDHFADSTDVLDHQALSRRLAAVYTDDSPDQRRDT